MEAWAINKNLMKIQGQGHDSAHDAQRHHLAENKIETIGGQNHIILII